jgi:hypothetical protein
MKKFILVIRIALEVVGVAALAYWGILAYLGHMFKDFAGGTCDDTHVIQMASPDGKHSAQRRFRTCGGHASTEVLLKTPYDSDPKNYMRVISIKDVDPEKMNISWTGPSDLLVNAPASGEIEEAYGTVFGVTITLNREN